MKRIIMAGMVLLTASAIAGAGAISVSASGHEFVASSTGKTKSSGFTQYFTLSGTTIECLKASGSGTITATKSTTHKETITYGECSGGGHKLTVSAAHYEFNANGPAKLEKQVVITGVGLGCEILIEPQTIEGMSYINASGDLKSEAMVSTIKALGTGGLCGGESTASYSGTITGELEGGTLEWK